MSKHITLLLGLILVSIALWVQLTSVESIVRVTTRLQNLAYDIQLRAHLFTHKKQFETAVAIIDIDEKSLDNEGRWPWPREKLASLITQLQKAGAVVIAFDMIFPENEINVINEAVKKLQAKNTAPSTIALLENIKPSFEHDVLFANKLSQIDSVLGITFLPTQKTKGLLPKPILSLSTLKENQLGIINSPGFVSNTPLLQKSAKTGGFINVFPDDDGIIRRVPLLMRYENNLYPSLALAAVQLYLLADTKIIVASYNDQQRIENIQLGNHLIPTDEKAQVIIPFRGKSFSYPYFSATDILHGKFSADALSGKIVFIGTSAIGLGDLKATAIENIFPGTEIQATIADGILTDHFSYMPAWALGAEVSITLFLGILFALLFPYLGPRALTLFILIVPASLFIANAYLWQKTGLIISILIPVALIIVLAMTNIIYGYLFESRRREKLKDMFGQYVPEKHIDEMLSSKDSYALQGEDREMTVLFADIRNFTTISEQFTAEQLKEMLNEFFTPMTEIIFKYHGTIDKYVGDMIMAFWGAPLKENNHAYHALCAALEMQQIMKAISLDFAKNKMLDIKIGIGINTGVMSVGDMGSKFRRNYTVLGDAVNLASRVEGLSKYYDAGIVVTENTRKNQSKFVFRQLDRVRVKGKHASVALYEVMGYAKEATPALLDEIALHHGGLVHYFQQKWQPAYDQFSALNQAHPEVMLYRIYLDRIDEFKKNPPPADWDGIYSHTSK